MRKWKLLIGKFWAEKVYSWLFCCMAVFWKYTMSNFGSILNQVVFILMGNNLVINCYNLIFFLTKMTKISCRYFYRILRKTRNSHTSGLWEWLPIHWLSLQRNRLKDYTFTLMLHQPNFNHQAGMQRSLQASTTCTNRFSPCSAAENLCPVSSHTLCYQVLLFWFNISVAHSLAIMFFSS